MQINGKYNTANVFVDSGFIDEAAVSQIINLLNQEAFKDSKIRIMPDVHAGAGCTIGTTMTITDKIVPNLVGVDIGCGMLCIELVEKEINLEAFDNAVKQYIPSGFNIREHPIDDFKQLKDLRCVKHVNLPYAYNSLGTLGGGNHFIELDRDDEGTIYLVIHTGSRHLGVEVATYYQKLAESKCLKPKDDEVKKLVDEYKSQGREKEISHALLLLKQKFNNRIPKDLCYLEGQDFDDYIADMRITQQYADRNRLLIADRLMKASNLHSVSQFTTIHNYIDIGQMILRKGAVRAIKDEHLIIPMNMRDGSLLCIGKGNEDWNYSAPHGAGRLMSRTQARKELNVDEFVESMNGIYTTTANELTIDEAPQAYKPMESIIEQIKDTVEIINIIKPIYNFKAAEENTWITSHLKSI